MAHLGIDAVAEDPEEQHVEEDVHEVAVEKLIGQELGQFEMGWIDGETPLETLAKITPARPADDVGQDEHEDVQGQQAIIDVGCKPLGGIGTDG